MTLPPARMTEETARILLHSAGRGRVSWHTCEVRLFVARPDDPTLARLVLSFWNPHIAPFAQLHALSFRIQSPRDKLIKIGVKVVNHSRYVAFQI